jgi:hypothetical protein
VDRGRNRRIVVRSPFEIDVCPGECAKLLGAGTGQKGEHDISVQSTVLGGDKQRLCLIESQGFRRSAVEPVRHGAQADDVAHDLVAGHSPVDGAVEDRVQQAQGACADDLRLGG